MIEHKERDEESKGFHVELTTVHDAMANAAAEIEGPVGMEPATYRITDEIKDTAAKICAQHGTTLSQFIRKCCEGLVKDYTGRSFD